MHTFSELLDHFVVTRAHFRAHSTVSPRTWLCRVPKAILYRDIQPMSRHGKSYVPGFSIVTESLEKSITTKNYRKSVATENSLSRQNSSVAQPSTMCMPRAVWSRALAHVVLTRNMVTARRHYHACGTIATCHAQSRQKCPALDQQPLSRYNNQCRDNGLEISIATENSVVTRT